MDDHKKWRSIPFSKTWEVRTPAPEGYASTVHIQHGVVSASVLVSIVYADDLW